MRRSPFFLSLPLFSPSSSDGGLFYVVSSGLLPPAAVERLLPGQQPVVSDVSWAAGECAANVALRQKPKKQCRLIPH